LYDFGEVVLDFGIARCEEFYIHYDLTIGWGKLNGIREEVIQRSMYHGGINRDYPTGFFW
jgi:hypothetical protein